MAEYRIECAINEVLPDYRRCDFTVFDGTEGIISGYLKWDGCVNWMTSERSYAHFCERGDAAALAEAFDKVRDWAIENWPDYEGD